MAVSPLVGASLLLFSWRVSARVARWVTLFALGLAALGTLILLPYAGYAPPVGIEWLPGTGPMGIALDATGLYAALVTTWSALLAALATRRSTAGNSSLSRALTLFALAGANVAFLSGHFLGRYVALEIVALSVALAPMVEMRGPAGNRLSTACYLVLRLGDAGLLAGILILWSAGNTLDIASALEAGKALDAARLGWTVAGFLLATWVKVGAWPLHVWQQASQQLALDTRSWLYAAVVPNLGMYLSYRVTPLLVLAGPLQAGTLWAGAGVATLAMVVALARRAGPGQSNQHSELVYLGAAQGGLALSFAASGAKSLVWLGLLVLTPLRLLLFLAADAAENTDSPARRRIAASAFGLGGLALAAYALLAAGWVRAAGGQLGPGILMEMAALLTLLWTAQRTRSLLSTARHTEAERDREMPLAGWSHSQPGSHSPGSLHWPGWATIGVLAGGVLVGGLAWGPLTRYLSLPTRSTGERLTPTIPAVLAAAALSGGIWLYRRWKGQPDRRHHPSRPEPEQAAYGLQEGLTQAAKALQGVVEVGVQERLLTWIVRAVVGSAQWTYRAMEERLLEGVQRHVVQAVASVGKFTYRTVEQKGLEGFLRQIPQAARALIGGLQQLATGKLRRNLVWVAIMLIVAILALAFGT